MKELAFYLAQMLILSVAVLYGYRRGCRESGRQFKETMQTAHKALLRTRQEREQADQVKERLERQLGEAHERILQLIQKPKKGRFQWRVN